MYGKSLIKRFLVGIMSEQNIRVIFFSFSVNFTEMAELLKGILSTSIDWNISLIFVESFLCKLSKKRRGFFHFRSKKIRSLISFSKST